jgi:ribosomal protein L18E
MGIDLKAGGRRTGHKSSMKVVKTKNPYNRLLIKLYKFLSRRTDSKFCATVLKRLHMSKVNQPPIGLHRLSKYMTNKESKIAVIVAKVTDDVRMLECPKMTVCALAFTETARKRIVGAGGECLTFDQLKHLPILDTELPSTTLTHTMVSSHMYDPLEESSKKLVVAVVLVVSRFNQNLIKPKNNSNNAKYNTIILYTKQKNFVPIAIEYYC